MDLHAMAGLARDAFFDLSVAPLSQRNEALSLLQKQLQADKEAIFAANRQDLAAAEGSDLPDPLRHRLIFGEEKLAQVLAGLQSLVALPDPVGKTLLSTEITPGLKLYRVSCPIGVLGIIFESRPDALIQISSLAIKSGNAVLL